MFIHQKHIADYGLDGRGVWGRVDPCICVAESLLLFSRICCNIVNPPYVPAYLVISSTETAWTVAHESPLSMEFSRQEYWSRLPFTSPGDLHDPGIEPASLVSASAGQLPLCYPYSNAKQKVKKKAKTHCLLHTSIRS